MSIRPGRARKLILDTANPIQAEIGAGGRETLQAELSFFDVVVAGTAEVGGGAGGPRRQREAGSSSSSSPGMGRLPRRAREGTRRAAADPRVH